MRMKHKAQKWRYIVIGGYSLGTRGTARPSIVLMEGNGYGEEPIRTLQTFDIGTRYTVVLERAKELANKLGVRVGREFTSDEWLGPEWQPTLEAK